MWKTLPYSLFTHNFWPKFWQFWPIFHMVICLDSKIFKVYYTIWDNYQLDRYSMYASTAQFSVLSPGHRPIRPFRPIWDHFVNKDLFIHFHIFFLFIPCLLTALLMADLNIWVMPSTVRTLLYSLAQSYIKGSSNHSARRCLQHFVQIGTKVLVLTFCKDNSKLCPRLSRHFSLRTLNCLFTLWWHFGEQLQRSCFLNQA